MLNNQIYFKVISLLYEFSSIGANGTCAGTCFIYLRPTAMPVGLAGLNKNKIVLRAVLAPDQIIINVLLSVF